MPTKDKKGMYEEIYEHISKNLHLLELDLEKGLILNRKSKSLNSNGYLRIGLAGKTILQHQIIAVARWGKDCIGMTVNHINECKTDNSWNNLELLTLEDNLKAKSRLSGSCNPKQPVKAIHLDTGKTYTFESHRDAGRKLGIHYEHIKFVLKGERNRVGRYTFEKIS